MDTGTLAAIIALVVALVALLVALMQLLAQLHESAEVLRKTSRDAFGDAYATSNRIWSFKAWRFSVEYGVPDLTAPVSYYNMCTHYTEAPSIKELRADIRAAAFQCQREAARNRSIYYRVFKGWQTRGWTSPSTKSRRVAPEAGVALNKTPDALHDAPACWNTYLQLCAPIHQSSSNLEHPEMLEMTGDMISQRSKRSGIPYTITNGDWLPDDFKIAVVRTTLQNLLLAGLSQGMTGHNVNMIDGTMQMSGAGSITSVRHPTAGPVYHYIPPNIDLLRHRVSELSSHFRILMVNMGRTTAWLTSKPLERSWWSKFRNPVYSNNAPVLPSYLDPEIAVLQMSDGAKMRKFFSKKYVVPFVEADVEVSGARPLYRAPELQSVRQNWATAFSAFRRLLGITMIKKEPLQRSKCFILNCKESEPITTLDVQGLVYPLTEIALGAPVKFKLDDEEMRENFKLGCFERFEFGPVDDLPEDSLSVYLLGIEQFFMEHDIPGGTPQLPIHVSSDKRTVCRVMHKVFRKVRKELGLVNNLQQDCGTIADVFVQSLFRKDSEGSIYGTFDLLEYFGVAVKGLVEEVEQRERIAGKKGVAGELAQLEGIGWLLLLRYLYVNPQERKMFEYVTDDMLGNGSALGQKRTSMSAIASELKSTLVSPDSASGRLSKKKPGNFDNEFRRNSEIAQRAAEKLSVGKAYRMQIAWESLIIRMAEVFFVLADLTHGTDVSWVPRGIEDGAVPVLLG